VPLSVLCEEAESLSEVWLGLRAAAVARGTLGLRGRVMDPQAALQDRRPPDLRDQCYNF
jgi:hypothetical protein